MFNKPLFMMLLLAGALSDQHGISAEDAKPGKADATPALELTLKNGKLEGTLLGGQFGQFKIDDAEIASGESKDGRETFVVKTKTGGNGRTTKYEGFVEGNAIKGTIDWQGAMELP